MYIKNFQATPQGDVVAISILENAVQTAPKFWLTPKGGEPKEIDEVQYLAMMKTPQQGVSVNGSIGYCTISANQERELFSHVNKFLEIAKALGCKDKESVINKNRITVYVPYSVVKNKALDAFSVKGDVLLRIGKQGEPVLNVDGSTVLNEDGSVRVYEKTSIRVELGLQFNGSAQYEREPEKRTTFGSAFFKAIAPQTFSVPTKTEIAAFNAAQLKTSMEAFKASDNWDDSFQVEYDGILNIPQIAKKREGYLKLLENTIGILA